MSIEKRVLPQPNLRKGWEIFATRPLSLIAALIMAVIICIISFMLLTFPAIAAYYYAVRHSKREEYFIDLNNIFRTTFLIFKGIGRYFVQSYILGFTGLLPVAILFITPVLPVILSGKQDIYLSLILQILWLPCFWIAGAVVFYGYPCLIATNNGIKSLRYALSVGKTRIFGTFARGFLLLCPFPAAIFHFFMVFSYPILAAWAVVTSEDKEDTRYRQQYVGRVTIGKVLFGLGLAAVMFCIIYFCAWKWGGTGLFIGLGISFCLVFIFASKLTH